MMACRHGHTDIVALLLAVPKLTLCVDRVFSVSPVSARSPGERLHAVSLAVITRGVHAVLRSTQAGTNTMCGPCYCLQEDRGTALIVASRDGHSDIVKLLLAVPHLDPNAAYDLECVSCVVGNHDRPHWHAVTTHGSLRVSLEVNCVSGRLCV
jgi:ankyrin repeat protein